MKLTMRWENSCAAGLSGSITTALLQAAARTTHARTHPCNTHRGTCLALIIMQQLKKREKKKRNQRLLHQRSCFCAPLIRFCMPGRAENSDEIRVPHGNGQPCCLHGYIKPFMETVGWEIVKKGKKKRRIRRDDSFSARCCMFGEFGGREQRQRQMKSEEGADVQSQMASLVPKGHCPDSFYSNFSQMTFPLQTVFKGKQRLFKRNLESI